MKIAVHTKELENARIDGTMVYISQVLRAMQELIDRDRVHLYHARPYNVQMPQIAHARFFDHILAQSPLWTQTRFATALWRDRPDVVWMPLHNAPYIRRKYMRTVVTIHDLAFKFFPDTYPTKDRRLLDFCTDHAVKAADDLITVSASTKNDLLAHYPHIPEERVHVIHHGFDAQLWQRHITEDQIQEVLQRYGLQRQTYIIHVGAIQPRKNLCFLIDAFADVKKTHKDHKLVLVGGDGWLAKEIHTYIARSPYKRDIVVTGNIAFSDVHVLMDSAAVCALPSLYEGFGMPGLEAMAAGTPVVAADNSCFPEVLGDGALYFNAYDIESCVRAMNSLLDYQEERAMLCARAKQRIRHFSWRVCAEKTLRVLQGEDA